MRCAGRSRPRPCGRLWCAPGNAGIAEVAECVAIGAEDMPALVAFARDNAVDLMVVGPEAPLTLGLADACAAAGIKVFGPTPGRRRAGGQQDLHQAGRRCRRRADRRLGALHRCRRRPRPCPRAGRPDRGQGGWAGRRQGRGGRHDGGRGRGRHRRDHGGRAPWRRRRRGGDRGMPGRPGGLVLRPVRRRDRAAARRRAGPQARRRWRHRPEHRRHGRLFPAAGLHRCAARRGHGPHHPPDPGRDGRAAARPSAACCSPG